MPPAHRVEDPLPPHGFYPVSLNLVGRACVVIGAADDREAIEKVAALRAVDADVRWITEPAALRDDDVAGAFFVISTPQDDALSARLRALADAHRFLLCTIDQPRFGFVAMQAIVAAGPVRIGISTGGVAPARRQGAEGSARARARREVRALHRLPGDPEAPQPHASRRRRRRAPERHDRGGRRLRARRARDVPAMVRGRARRTRPATG